MVSALSNVALDDVLLLPRVTNVRLHHLQGRADPAGGGPIPRDSQGNDEAVRLAQGDQKFMRCSVSRGPCNGNILANVPVFVL